MKHKTVCLRGYLEVFGDVLLKGPLMTLPLRGPASSAANDFPKHECPDKLARAFIFHLSAIKRGTTVEIIKTSQNQPFV